MKFTWDPAKAKINLRKHDVSFEEAGTIFKGPVRIEYDSENSTESEDRWIAIGISEKLNLLLVVYCERQGDTFRIIHARKKG